MKSVFSISILICIAVQAFAYDLVVSQVRVPMCETFSGFKGTLASLPAGFSVSRDGQVLDSMTNNFHGTNDGGVGPGGCYAWVVGLNDFALGCQPAPTSTNFSPGYFMLTISNATPQTVRRLDLAYDILYYNDQGRSSSIDLEFSLDGAHFTKITDLRFVTPSEKDKIALWTRIPRSRQILLPGGIPVSGRLWIKWSFADSDSSGSGSRDELGIDNVQVALYPPPGTVISLMP